MRVRFVLPPRPEGISEERYALLVGEAVDAAIWSAVEEVVNRHITEFLGDAPEEG